MKNWKKTRRGRFG